MIYNTVTQERDYLIKSIVKDLHDRDIEHLRDIAQCHHVSIRAGRIYQASIIKIVKLLQRYTPAQLAVAEKLVELSLTYSYEDLQAIYDHLTEDEE